MLALQRLYPVHVTLRIPDFDVNDRLNVSGASLDCHVALADLTVEVCSFEDFVPDNGLTLRVMGVQPELMVSLKLAMLQR